MARRYYIDQRNAAGKLVVGVAYTEAHEALASFAAALYGAEHLDPAVNEHLKTWTVVLMSGGTSMNVLDPDLQGSIEIHITS